MLLHGVIDSPDIPLNVSRSYLQSDSNVKKINSYITKKVADKLNELFKEDKKEYESKWKDIGIFVKYGMISEEKFYEKAIEFALVESLDGKFRTIPEYQKFIKNNFNYVGDNFAYEARSIHYNNQKKDKGIYGTASKQDLKELKEEGIDAQMVPWFESENS